MRAPRFPSWRLLRDASVQSSQLKRSARGERRGATFRQSPAGITARNILGLLGVAEANQGWPRPIRAVLVYRCHTHRRKCSACPACSAVQVKLSPTTIHHKMHCFHTTMVDAAMEFAASCASTECAGRPSCRPSHEEHTASIDRSIRSIPNLLGFREKRIRYAMRLTPRAWAHSGVTQAGPDSAVRPAFAGDDGFTIPFQHKPTRNGASRASFGFSSHHQLI